MSLVPWTDVLCHKVRKVFIQRSIIYEEHKLLELKCQWKT